MPNFQEQEIWEDGIYQLQPTDPVGGGPNGASNIQAKQLANRTAYLKKKTEEAQSEIDEAAGGHNTLAERINSMEVFGGMKLQTGTVVFHNRGIVSGCTVSKSVTATRNLSYAGGSGFANGQIFPVSPGNNVSIVPSNNSEEEKSSYSYFYFDESNKIKFATTALGDVVPEYGIPLALITVPAGNNDTNDPNLDSVVITDIRRVEVDFPVNYNSEIEINVPLPYAMADDDYSISLDVIQMEGSGFQRGDIYTGDRNVNGFKIYYNGAGDNIVIRWEVTKPEEIEA